MRCALNSFVTEKELRIGFEVFYQGTVSFESCVCTATYAFRCCFRSRVVVCFALIYMNGFCCFQVQNNYFMTIDIDFKRKQVFHFCG